MRSRRLTVWDRAGRARILAAILVAVACTGAAAQTVGETAPRRPRLKADADTNSATAYYSYGISALDKDPAGAAAAFYWASRLDPTWAAPLYGQHSALLLALPHGVLTEYLASSPRALREPGIRHLDSLAYLALQKNPFVERRFDGVVLSVWMHRESNGPEKLRTLTAQDRRLAGWVAYAGGQYKAAASTYGEVIRLHPGELEPRYWKARSFFAMGMVDSARGVLRAARGHERQSDPNSGGGWTSNSFTEYSIRFLFELKERADSARAAYERALVKDLSFHPAHYRLARLRLLAGDSAGALAEFTQAATLDPENAPYLCDLGMLLLGMGRSDSAAAILLRAATVEPYFGTARLILGTAYEQGGHRKEAMEQYTAFLSLAPRSLEPMMADVRNRLTALRIAGH